MREITKSIRDKIKAIARKHCKNNVADYEDAFSEGLLKVLEMPEGHKEGYYLTGANYRMRDYLKKERLFRERNMSLEGIEGLSESTSEESIDEFYVYGTKISRGKKTPKARLGDDYSEDY